MVSWRAKRPPCCMPPLALTSGVPKGVMSRKDDDERVLLLLLLPLLLLVTMRSTPAPE